MNMWSCAYFVLFTSVFFPCRSQCTRMWSFVGRSFRLSLSLLVTVAHWFNYRHVQCFIVPHYQLIVCHSFPFPIGCLATVCVLIVSPRVIPHFPWFHAPFLHYICLLFLWCQCQFVVYFDGRLTNIISSALSFCSLVLSLFIYHSPNLSVCLVFFFSFLVSSSYSFHLVFWWIYCVQTLALLTTILWISLAVPLNPAWVLAFLITSDIIVCWLLTLNCLITPAFNKSLLNLVRMWFLLLSLTVNNIFVGVSGHLDINY